MCFTHKVLLGSAAQGSLLITHGDFHAFCCRINVGSMRTCTCCFVGSMRTCTTHTKALCLERGLGVSQDHDKCWHYVNGITHVLCVGYGCSSISCYYFCSSNNSCCLTLLLRRITTAITAITIAKIASYPFYSPKWNVKRNTTECGNETLYASAQQSRFSLHILVCSDKIQTFICLCHVVKRSTRLIAFTHWKTLSIQQLDFMLYGWGRIQRPPQVEHTTQHNQSSIYQK